jgi:hypothetical protein
MPSTANKSSQISVSKDKLEVSERGRLRKLELVVSQAKEHFIAIGKALQEIRDSRLYREDYKTFDKYVEQKWGFKKSRAYQLIDASEVSTKLSTIVDESARVSEVKNEGQLRELKGVSTESIPAVIDRAVELAGDDKITASDLKQARVEILEQVEPELVYEDVDDTEEITPLLKKPAKTPAEKLSPAKQAIQNGKQLQPLQTAVNDLLRMFDNVPHMEGLELFHGRINRIRKDIESAKAQLLIVKPYAVCPRCDGACCTQCGNMGFVSSVVFRELERGAE